MACYLFAAYSLKRSEPELHDDERDAIQRWQGIVLDVARDEMVHLALANNLLASIGSAPHFGRPNFPVAPGYHPAGVVVSLAPFDRATLDHFIYLERPEGVDRPDGAGFMPRAYQRGQGAGRLVPSAQDYATVGHLYRGIRSGFNSLARKLGEGSLFVGDPTLQIGPDLLPMDGLTKVRSLVDADRAIDTIVLQGEGSTAREGQPSHYSRFLAISREYDAFVTKNPEFVPGRPVARSPVMRRPPEPAGKVWISAEPAGTILDLANGSYALMLRALAGLYSPVAAGGETRSALSELVITTMRLLGPLAQRLTMLPASDDVPGTMAGMTFTMSRSLSGPADAHGLRGIAEAAAAVAGGVRAHVAGDAALARYGALLDDLAGHFVSLSTRTVPRRRIHEPPAASSRRNGRTAGERIRRCRDGARPISDGPLRGEALHSLAALCP